MKTIAKLGLLATAIRLHLEKRNKEFGCITLQCNVTLSDFFCQRTLVPLICIFSFFCILVALKDTIQPRLVAMMTP